MKVPDSRMQKFVDENFEKEQFISSEITDFVFYGLHSPDKSSFKNRLQIFSLKFVLSFFLFSTISAFQALSQGWLPILRNSKGEIIQYQWPPADSSYVRNELIIYFRPQALNLDKLCFDIDPEAETQNEDKPNDKLAGIVNHLQRAYLFNQRFPVDSLIADSSLLAVIKSYGGDTLRRMSITSPCRDTIAIASVYKDTLRCYDYLYMVLHFNNDTSVVNAGIYLNIFFQNMINWASFNLLFELAREPIKDNLYENQISLQDNTWPFGMSHFSSAWDYQTGNDVKVAVIDNGIDYFHCDLGGGYKGPGYKVRGGWSYDLRNAEDFYQCSEHGTPVAGIIGAYTNYTKCPAQDGGIAGIAGGWGGPENLGGEGIGCQLIGLDISDRALACAQYVNGVNTWTAFREACRWTRSDGGEFNSEIINISVGTQTLPDIALRDAVNYAYQCGVCIIASAGNQGNDMPAYPSSYDPAWVTRVGASNIYKARVGYSNVGNFLDLIAPGGQTPGIILSPDRYLNEQFEKNDQIDYSSYFNPATPYNHNLYQAFGGTSAAAPHVSGLVALLRADAVNDWNQADTPGEELEPEDFEGMIKASCDDITDDYNLVSDNDFYKNYYDLETGWGFVRADKIFQMIRDRGYKLIHLKNDDYSSFTSTLYKDNANIIIQNPGYPINKTWTIPSGTYTGVKVWQLDGTINIPGFWLNNEGNPLFVWGRSGQANKSGLDKPYDPNDNNSQLTSYQSGFTQVTDGQNGNSLVDGIYHNQDFTVSVTTYQYELILDGKTVKLPPDDELGANISVFGVLLPGDVNEEEINSIGFHAKITPNPVNDVLHLKIYTIYPEIISIQVYGCLGNIALKCDENLFSNVEDFDINVSDLQTGVYILKINSKNGVEALKFVKGVN